MRTMITRLRDILAGRCPRCRKGLMFVSTIEVHKNCPECQLLLDREAGYFLGAMYMEYALGALFIGSIFLALKLFGHLAIYPAVIIAFVAFLPFIPKTIRISRALWIYWDNALDPQK